MNFTTYVENRFQELTMQSQSEPYNVVVDAKLKALHGMLNNYRVILKWIVMPQLIYHYILVRLGWREAPTPVLVNKLKQDQKDKKPFPELHAVPGEVVSDQ